MFRTHALVYISFRVPYNDFLIYGSLKRVGSLGSRTFCEERALEPPQRAFQRFGIKVGVAFLGFSV